jgi:hypothetical protein
LDLGLFLQQLGTGIDNPIRVEIQHRSTDGTFVARQLVEVQRVSTISPNGSDSIPARTVRVIIEKADIDKAPLLP